MNVNIKKFSVDMQIKTAGIELDVSDNQDNHLGDLFITKASLIWCHGKTPRKNGVKVEWADFIAYMEGE